MRRKGARLNRREWNASKKEEVEKGSALDLEDENNILPPLSKGEVQTIEYG